MPSETPEDQKPVIDVPAKSSMEILSELFETFDAEPPIIVKTEQSDTPPRKNKKSKKKHKHKDKKEKKRKDKKRKRSRSSSSDKAKIDLAEILIKEEKESHKKKIKIEGTDLSFNLNNVKKERDAEKSKEKKKKSDEEKKKKNDKKIEIKLKTKDLNKDKAGKRNAEEGEISDSSTDGRKAKKHKSRDDRTEHKKKHNTKEKSREKHKSKSEERAELKLKIEDLRNKINENQKSNSSRRSKSRERYSRSDDFYRSRDRDREKDDSFYRKERDKDRERKSRDRDKHSDYKSRKNSRENVSYKDDDFYKGSDVPERDNRGYGRDKDRHRGHYDRDRRHRNRSSSREDSSHIDKKKLLEIARKNAIQMMKSGSLPGALTLGPQAQEKVIAAIKAGGKTIEELTDFCKTLSKKEEMGDLSSNPEENGSDSDADVPFHHPFQIKDRPTSITMNIKNSVPLPLKSTQERSTELRMQFPVSSGQQHRKTENEWVPVSPKKTEATPTPVPKPSLTTTTASLPLAIEAAPPVPKPVPEPVPVKPGPQVFPVEVPSIDMSSSDISSIVSQRLSAMRKLQENPHDVQALTQMYKSNKEMQTWAQSKQQPGLFTGTTGAQILSQAELASGYQAWAKKDQLQSATPVSGGMGMHLLQKMGWKPGEGLGKEKTGALEPLLLEVKLDKKGLVANEEQKKKKKQTQTFTVKTLQNKHPVSLLGEFASKRKLGAPQYTLCFECGPDHKKNFLFKVTINGVEYKPNIASPNKKEAKAAAATICLQELGLYTS